MGSYFLRRLLLLPVTLLGITFIAFLITRFVPGGPLEQALAEKQAAASLGGRGSDNSGTLSPEEELQLKRYYRLDQPLLSGYGQWLGLWPGPDPLLAQIILIPPGTGTFATSLKVVVDDTGAAPLLADIPATISLGTDTQGGHHPKVALAPEAGAALEAFAQEKNLDPETVRRKAGAAWKIKLLPPNLSPGATPPEQQPLRVDVYQNKFSGLLQGNFGRSFLRNRPVLDVILEKVPVSAWFGIWSLFLTYSVCIPLGILKALKHRTTVDNATSVLLFVGYAVPGYILAVILQYFLAFKLHLFPHSGFTGAESADLDFFARLKDLVWHTTLPLLCLTSGSFALMTMLMKNTLMDNLALDYVRTAVAKGVSFRTAVLHHAFRNSLVPIATGFGNCLALLLTGSFLIEKIFDIDGIGLLSYNSLVGRDYPVFLGLLSCSAFLLLLGNILSDLCVALVDPRIRFGK